MCDFSLYIFFFGYESEIARQEVNKQWFLEMILRFIWKLINFSWYLEYFGFVHDDVYFCLCEVVYIYST